MNDLQAANSATEAERQGRPMEEDLSKLVVELLGQKIDSARTFSDVFAEEMGYAGATLKEVKYSQRLPHGGDKSEVDILLCYQLRGGEVVRALVENKIDCPLHDDQATRYLEMAREQSKQPNIHDCQAMLFSPRHYQKSGVEKFKHRVFYEEVVELLAEFEDPLSRNLAKRLEIAAQAIPVPNRMVEVIWNYLKGRIAEKSLPLILGDSQKTGEALWLRFNRSIRPQNEDARQVSLVYKAANKTGQRDPGKVDLQFEGVSYEALERAVSGIALPAGAVVRKAEKSSCISIEVPCLDFEAAPETQVDNMDAGLEALETLRKFYLRSGESIYARLLGPAASNLSPQ